MSGGIPVLPPRRQAATPIAAPAFGAAPVAFAIGLLLAVADVPPAAGQALCVRPLAPTCVEVDQTYQSDDERDGCQEELAGYESEVRGYQACLQDEARDAARDHERVVARFRCRLSGSGDCGPAPDSAAKM